MLLLLDTLRANRSAVIVLMYKKKGRWCQPYFVACKTVSKYIYYKLKKSDKRFIHKLVSQLELTASFLMSALNRLFPISKQKLPNASVTECLWPNLLISVFWKYIWKRLKLSDSTENPDKCWLDPMVISAYLKKHWLQERSWVIFSGHVLQPPTQYWRSNKFLSHMQHKRGHSCYRWLPRHTSTTSSSYLCSCQLISSLLWILPYTP